MRKTRLFAVAVTVVLFAIGASRADAASVRVHVDRSRAPSGGEADAFQSFISFGHGGFGTVDVDDVQLRGALSVRSRTVVDHFSISRFLAGATFHPAACLVTCAVSTTSITGNIVSPGTFTSETSGLQGTCTGDYDRTQVNVGFVPLAAEVHMSLLCDLGPDGIVPIEMTLADTSGAPATAVYRAYGVYTAGPALP
jgi:hypothetical protein